MFADDFGDVFEAGQALEAFNSECFRDSVDQSGRYDGLDYLLLAVEPSQIAPALDQVIGQQCAGLIAVKQYILPVFIWNRHSDAVGIGICCQYQVGFLFGCQIERHLHRGAFFRIRRNDCREVAVGNVLLLDRNDVAESEFAEGCGNEDNSRAVQRRVDDFHVPVRCNGFGRKR